MSSCEPTSDQETSSNLPIMSEAISTSSSESCKSPCTSSCSALVRILESRHKREVPSRSLGLVEESPDRRLVSLQVYALLANAVILAPPFAVTPHLYSLTPRAAPMISAISLPLVEIYVFISTQSVVYLFGASR